MNHWLKKHLRKIQNQLDIRDNYNPITLYWNEVQEEAMMPILRQNYVEIQGGWNIHMTEIELERTKQWENVFTSL